VLLNHLTVLLNCEYLKVLNQLKVLLNHLKVLRQLKT
jgi:hypothetical protein